MDHFETQTAEDAPGPPSPGRRGASANTSCNDRIVELEMENSRLQQLVAELLIKNHQLRKPE
jgi:hypothetical protein